ncbi:MAG: arginine repressor [Eubacteriaceae bacterium]
MKIGRQAKILEIIEKYPTETQEELADRLSQSGYKATQATISRDIKELKLIKASGPDGRQIYSAYKGLGNLYDERVHTVFKQTVLSIDHAYFLIIMHTLPAMAQGAALAIDSLEWSEIAGTIAGDDTIFVAVYHEEDVEPLITRFRKLMK